MTNVPLLIAALIAAVPVALTAAALMSPRRHLRTEILINAPVAAVWPLIGDPARHAEWNPNLRRMTGTLTQGTTFTMTLGAPGARAMTFHPQVLSRVEGHHVTWRGRLWLPRIFDGIHTLRLEAVDATRTRFVNEEAFTGLMLWMMDTDQFRPDFEASNAGLKRLAEGQSS